MLIRRGLVFAAAVLLAAAGLGRPQVAAATAQGGPIDRVKIYLVAIGDNGRSGPKIGCGDSLVPVSRSIPPTRAPLTAALRELLSLHTKTYGASGLYNALALSRLTVEAVSIAHATGIVKLSGTLAVGGECDDPRILAQLTATARQFPSVRSASVFVNGRPLENLLSGRGK